MWLESRDGGTNEADGQDSADEFEALENLCGEMGIALDVDMAAVLGDVDVVHFDTHRSKVIVSLELMRLVYADDFIHEAEVAEVLLICREMAFPDEWIVVMIEWAKRLSWTEAEPEDSERAAYQAALVDYAHRIMALA